VTEYQLRIMRDRKHTTHNAWLKIAYALCAGENDLRIMRDEKIFCYAYSDKNDFGDLKSVFGLKILFETPFEELGDFQS
jgi:hypothetical protein